ncbi:MAG: hypothetical protein JKY48_11390 [Flavobacteriales bacterium]|nr:hypothetical protein [Flavobacteriales bacterium]
MNNDSENSVAKKHRQKSYTGNGLILKHIRQYYKKPVNFQVFVRLSQETQAKGLKVAIRTHINKQPHCMGNLFWQLNDWWPEGLVGVLSIITGTKN